MTILAAMLMAGCGNPAPEIDAGFEPVDDAGFIPDSGQDAGPIVIDAVLLTLALDPDRPVRRNLIMGSVGQEVFRFDLTASLREAVHITRLTVLLEEIMSVGSVRNLRLIDAVSGEQYGGTVSSPERDGSVVFDLISNLTIPAGGSVAIKIVIDVTSYADGGLSGDHFYPTIRGTVDGVFTIAAVGAESGHRLTARNVRFIFLDDIQLLVGNWMFIYRTVPSIAVASDAPSGVVTPSSEQIVAKFVATNSVNVGSYSVEIRQFNLDVSSTIRTTAPRVVRAYVDRVTRANLIAEYTYPAGVLLSDVDFGDLLPSVDIASGFSRFLLVTMDTTDALADDRVQVGLDVDDVTWSDGVSTVTEVNGFPITGNTLLY